RVHHLSLRLADWQTHATVMDTSLFDFDLPQDLIALRPAEPRGTGRMLVVDPAGAWHHASIGDLPRYLNRGDCLAVNDTKVIAARLMGRRARRASGPSTVPKIEVMLHKRLAADRFLAFARPARKLAAGDQLVLGSTLAATVVTRGEGGEIEVGFALSGSALDAAIQREGELPLPPYIVGKRRVDDRDVVDYQTTFASQLGSVAAPTAGLHFTPQLLGELAAAGVECE